MDDQRLDVGSTLVPGAPVEGWMLREDVVREVLARLARGEHVKAVARELGVDKKTINRWRQRGRGVHGGRGCTRKRSTRIDHSSSGGGPRSAGLACRCRNGGPGVVSPRV